VRSINSNPIPTFNGVREELANRRDEERVAQTFVSQKVCGFSDEERQVAPFALDQGTRPVPRGSGCPSQPRCDVALSVERAEPVYAPRRMGADLPCGCSLFGTRASVHKSPEDGAGRQSGGACGIVPRRLLCTWLKTAGLNGLQPEGDRHTTSHGPDDA